MMKKLLPVLFFLSINLSFAQTNRTVVFSSNSSYKEAANEAIVDIVFSSIKSEEEVIALKNLLSEIPAIRKIVKGDVDFQKEKAGFILTTAPLTSKELENLFKMINVTEVILDNQIVSVNSFSDKYSAKAKPKAERIQIQKSQN